ncbi:Chromatin remodeling factor mit1, partial [Ceratocystis fimbriata CBS 114723]
MDPVEAAETMRTGSSHESPTGQQLRHTRASKTPNFDHTDNPTSQLASEAIHQVSQQKGQSIWRSSSTEMSMDGRAPSEQILEDGSILVSRNAPAPAKFEIVLPGPPIDKDSYQEISPDVVNQIMSVIKDANGEDWFEVAYIDGRHEMVKMNNLLDIENGSRALSEFSNGHLNTSRKRRRSAYRLDSSESSPLPNAKRIDLEGDDLEDDSFMVKPHQTSIKRYMTPAPRSYSQVSISDQDLDARSSRRSSRARTTVRRSIGVGSLADTDDELSQSHQRRQPRRAAPKGASISYVDAFMSSGDENDDDFLIVRSNITPSSERKQRRGRGRGRRSTTPNDQSTSTMSSSPELSDEPAEDSRRSKRATRNRQSMREISRMDLESFYIGDEEPPQTPKVMSIKENFKPIPRETLFAQRHMQVCDSCNSAARNDRGLLVYCQGCSLSYHRMCLGPRRTRDHMATKIGEDDFVLQCKFCIGRYYEKDKLAPRMEQCQSCHIAGKSCAAFSKRKTPKQEEKLREQNNGVDPITPVDPALVNATENALFRCTKCRRAWHTNHLPPLNADSSDIPEDLWKEYALNWKCTACLTYTAKIDTIVAWRLVSDAEPHNSEETSAKQQLSETEGAPPKAQIAHKFHDYVEDEKQYLIKWDHKSYAHVTWMPGAWVYSVAQPTSRKAFIKRSYQQELYKKNTETAVPDEFLIVDIIFNVKYHSWAPRANNYEEDLERLDAVSKIYFKPQGLGYSDSVWDTPPDKENSDAYHSFVIAYQQYLSGKYFVHEPLKQMQQRVANFKASPFEDVILSAQPKSMKGKLMEYQLNGVNWMLRRYHNAQNAILADEMGLGKTVQVITLLTTLIQQGPRVWPFLVVVPNSTCPNWRREIKQWSPNLRVVTYYGGKDAQSMAYEYELFPSGSTSEMRAHIVVMSYESAQDEETRKSFRRIQWAGLVVDEGQRLKNDKNILYTALRSMRFPFRLLLTGTPLQNNTRELFNLLQFIDPNFSAEELDEKFKDLNAEKIHELHKLINPYFYRRTKAGVLKFLPAMSQIIVPVSMTVLQEKLCKSIMAKNPQLIQAIFRKTFVGKQERGSLNNILMQLRRCLCHPFLYSDAIEERTENAALSHRNLVEASGKLILLEGLLPRLKEQGHRVLIFSQFLGQLDIIEDFLSGLGMESTRLDGSVSSLERQKRIDRYNQPNSPLFAFLLTTGAGGVGINLATADTVIILDPDFNPKRDLQALSRAHRIGQKNKVLCLQFMVKDSVEEKIMQMSKKKMALDHALIERMGASAEDGNDLESVLKHGAEALFKEDSNREVIRYDSEAIEKLLDRSFTKADQEANPESEFTYGKVWSNESGGTVKDSLGDNCDGGAVTSQVWEKILAQREAEALQELEVKKEILGRGGRARRAVDYRADKNTGPTKDSENPDADPDFHYDSGDGHSHDSDDEAVGKSEDSSDDKAIPDPSLKLKPNPSLKLKPDPSLKLKDTPPLYQPSVFLSTKRIALSAESQAVTVFSSGNAPTPNNEQPKTGLEGIVENPAAVPGIPGKYIMAPQPMNGVLPPYNSSGLSGYQQEVIAQISPTAVESCRQGSQLQPL